MSNSTSKSLVAVEPKVGFSKLTSKKCLSCQTIKKPDEFSVSTGKKDGLQGRCKACWKLYNRQNRDRQKDIKAAWYQSNKDSVIATTAEYSRVNKESRRIRDNNRYATDSVFRLKIIIRNLVNRSLRKHADQSTLSTMSIVGLNLTELKIHLSQGFWEVYGRFPSDDDKLDIDHIVPLASAILSSDVLRLNYYTNLRYLLRCDNQAKKAKLDWSYYE